MRKGHRPLRGKATKLYWSMLAKSKLQLYKAKGSCGLMFTGTASRNIKCTSTSVMVINKQQTAEVWSEVTDGVIHSKERYNVKSFTCERGLQGEAVL